MLTKFLLLAVLTVSLSQCVLGEWRWKNRVAVVTGASSGIGEEIAVQLANKGMIVAALARRENLLKKLQQRTVGIIYPVVCDLTVEEDIVKAFAWIENNLGGVDVLVNNAGTFISSSLINGTTQEWKTMLDLNILGTTIASREALKTMRKRGDNGQIININSVAGHIVLRFPGQKNGLYSGSKFAITALSEALNNELSDVGSKIKVTSISPGLVLTELVLKTYGTSNDLAPFVEVDDIAEAVIYVLSTKPDVRVSELTIQHR